MPTTRRRRMRKPQRPDVSEALFVYLTFGDWYAARRQQKRDGTNAGELFFGWPTYPEKWASIVDRAVAEWSAKYPGTRPVSWWEWTAPEPLRGAESQAAYLDRLSLWLPGERDRVPGLGAM